MTQDQTNALYKRAGLANQLGFGLRPALLIVDMQIAFTDPEKFALAGNFGSQIETINKLILAARLKEVPIIFTAIAYEHENQIDGGLWLEKIPALRRLIQGSELVKLDPRLASDPQDLIIYKNYASSFFGTNLDSILSSKGIDTLIITGCTTSGCIRATAVDSVSYGFRPIIPLEAVGDRTCEPHEANIFDINAKYGDVVAADVAFNYLATLP